MNPLRCSHGKTWNEPCLECEAISLRGTIASFEPVVISAKKRLQEVDREISKAADRAVKNDVRVSKTRKPHQQ